MNQVICDAIRNRSVPEFTNNGYHRAIEPHAGRLSKAWNDVIRCYQTAGTSDSGIVPAWKLMKVDEIISLIMTGEHFVGTRPEYVPGEHRYDHHLWRALATPQSHSSTG